ncbi:MAG: NtaA/DmoA family FMN-dependent monooxygenase, partial [Gammaproteobacteria bacterium]
MTRRMLFNAFQMNCVTHQSPGLWTRDEDQTTRYKELDYWLDYARLVERGCFDAVFLADVVGTYDVYGGNREAALRSAAQTPVNDPMLVIPAMATVTKHLGFGVTSAMLQYHPYTFARQMSTLDHLTRGRIGWNVVTGYLDSAARAYGLEALPEHDQRYEIADEYASLCYRLWEDSWAEDAVQADRKTGVYTDPSRVRDIDHDGRYFRVHGCHVSEPSPQRTPVLFQAGTSSRGTDFAARHAECVFVIGSKPHVAGDYARGIREKAVAGGRRGEDIAVFAYMKIVVGGTEAEAKRKYDDLFESVDIDGALALMCGWSGMDLSQVDMDQPIEYIETNAIRTFLHS